MPKKATATAPALDPKEKSLKQKMAQSVVGAAPSMIPAPRVPQGEVPAAPEAEPIIPGIDELLPAGEDKDALRKLIDIHIQLNSQIKPLEKQIDAIKERIKTTLSGYGITNMVCDGAKVSYTVTERRTLNHNKLIAAGVDTEIIVACTDISKSSMLKITPAKD